MNRSYCYSLKPPVFGAITFPHLVILSGDINPHQNAGPRPVKNSYNRFFGPIPLRNCPRRGALQCARLLCFARAQRGENE